MDQGHEPNPALRPTAPPDAVGPVGHALAVVGHFEGPDLRAAVVGAAAPCHSLGVRDAAATLPAILDAIRACAPARADGLIRLAALAAADDLVLRGLPRVFRYLIHVLPSWPAAFLVVRVLARQDRLLAGAPALRLVQRHPMTFAPVWDEAGDGCGRDEALAMGDWQAAVIERVFARLVWPSAIVQVAQEPGEAGALRFRQFTRAPAMQGIVGGRAGARPKEGVRP